MEKADTNLLPIAMDFACGGLRLLIFPFQKRRQRRTFRSVTGLLSIARRELAVGARQTSTHRVRLMAGGGVVGLFILFLLFNDGPPSSVGPKLFGLSSFFLFVQALLSGVRYTADALSEEKREGTLGLLFLTELRSGEVVLGKMIVRSLRGFYALIATLPVFTFCILFGGVRGLDAFYMALVLLTTMTFSLAACIYISSRSVEDKSAFVASLGILAAFTFIPPILWKICFTLAPRLLSWDFLLFPSPAFAFSAIPRTGSRLPEFLNSIGALLLLSSMFLVLSARQLTNSFKEQFTVKKSSETDAFDGQLSIRSTRTFSRPLLDGNPYYWLLDRDRFYQILTKVFSAFILLGGIILGILIPNRAVGFVGAIAIYSLYAMHWVWKLLLTSHALRRLHDDHRSGALEILLVTPLRTDQILAAQSAHTFWTFLWGALALIVADVILFSRTFSDIPVVIIGAAIFLFIDARVLIWRSILQAFKPSRYPIAVLRVIGIVLLPPIILLGLILFSGRGISSRDGNVLFVFWYLGCGLYDLILLRRARNMLSANFRSLASEQFQFEPRASTLPKALQRLLAKETQAQAVS